MSKAKKQKIECGVLHREMTFTREAIDDGKRTVELSFSSEEPVDRFFGNEILDHSPEAVMLDRLNDGAPLLVDHDSQTQVGVVERAWIEGRRGKATVRFGKSPRAEQEFTDVKDGIRRKVSVGYRIHRMKLEDEDDGEETYRVDLWEPFEISTVAIPADATVGVGRDDHGNKNAVEIIHEMKRNQTLLDPNPSDGGGGAPAITEPKLDLDAIRRQEAEKLDKANQKRWADLKATAERFNCIGKASEFFAEGKTVEELRQHLLETRYNAKPTDSPTAGEIGMSRGEVQRYSILEAVRDFVANGRVSGLYKEASDSVAKRVRRDPQGFFIPFDVASRALNATTASAGGYTVSEDLLTASMIELLRNNSAVIGLGATTLSGLQGNVAIPKHTGGATAYWLSETAAATDSQQTFGQLALVPHRLVATTPISKQLIAQSGIDVEAFVRNDIMTTLAIAKDLACINGLGAAGEPLGILNTTGINSVTFGAAPTWAKVLEFEGQLAVDNAAKGTMAFLTTPLVRSAWMGTPKVTNQAVFLWEPGEMVAGRRADSSNQVPSNKVIFGNWADLIVADWDGMDVVVDPYTLAKSNQVQITVTIMSDCGVRHPVSFCASTDAGNQ